jgi:hypothetical protein
MEVLKDAITLDPENTEMSDLMKECAEEIA